MNDPNLQKAVPFFRVSDVSRSKAFYVEGLGFDIRIRWPAEGPLRWCWLQRGPVALMLQGFPTTGHDSWVPEGKPGQGVSICIICDDALAFYRETLAKGLRPSVPVVGNGMWVTTLFDPDGYRLDFESTTDQPESTVYRAPGS